MEKTSPFGPRILNKNDTGIHTRSKNGDAPKIKQYVKTHSIAKELSESLAIPRSKKFIGGYVSENSTNTEQFRPAFVEVDIEIRCACIHFREQLFLKLV